MSGRCGGSPHGMALARDCYGTASVVVGRGALACQSGVRGVLLEVDPPQSATPHLHLDRLHTTSNMSNGHCYHVADDASPHVLPLPPCLLQSLVWLPAQRWAKTLSVAVLPAVESLEGPDAQQMWYTVQ